MLLNFTEPMVFLTLVPCNWTHVMRSSLGMPSSLTPTSRICHTSAVKRLQWKPLDQGQEEGESSTPHFPAELMLASCSQDHAIRLFTVWWSSSSS